MLVVLEANVRGYCYEQTQIRTRAFHPFLYKVEHVITWNVDSLHLKEFPIPFHKEFPLSFLWLNISLSHGIIGCIVCSKYSYVEVQTPCTSESDLISE